MRGGRKTIRDLWESVNDKRQSVTETSASATSVSVYRPYIKGGREGTLACLAAGNGAASTPHSSAGLFLFSAVFICLCAPVRLFYSPRLSQHMSLFEQL